MEFGICIYALDTPGGILLTTALTRGIAMTQRAGPRGGDVHLDTFRRDLKTSL